MKIPHWISKTKLMRGYQCEKSLYLSLHHKDLESPITAEQEAIFDQGSLVGELARQQFTNGLLVDNKPWDFLGSIKKTRELLTKKNKVIFEAAFDYQGCYARADIIQYNPLSDRWLIFEVKSSTKIKEEQIDDVSLQAWIMAKAGLPIEKIFIMHLNPECTYPDLSNLFISQDVTEQVRLRYPKIAPKISQLFLSINQPNPPNINIGPHCHHPNPCSFIEHCWSKINWPEYHVFDLPKIGDKKWEYFEKQQLDLKTLPTQDLDTLQARVVECVQSQQQYLDQNLIKQEISKWAWPLLFLDFETINPAIPRYPGSSPYQHIPFQFSLHIWSNPDSQNLEHFEYLHQDETDPRPALLKKLIPLLLQPGTIIAYYKKFEVTRLQEMALQFSAYQSEITQICERIQDPLPILRQTVYNLNFKGSYSLKKVAPALLGERYNYQDLAVDNGLAAQRAYELIIDPKTSSHDKHKLVESCLLYCRQDTQVLVDLVKWMLNLTTH